MASQNKDCGPKCRSKQHALQLLTSITRGTTNQIKLFLQRCHNPTTVTDTLGRSVLHMAACRGRWDVIAWLLEEYRVEINLKDLESGWTSLHRALFYGQIHAAKVLIEHGCNIQTRDKEGLTPLDIIMKDRLPHVEFSPTAGINEVFSWGYNSNATLGHDKMQARRQPEVVDYFRKRSVSIRNVVLSKYHTVFLSNEGKVYTCGHGQGGRLGHGNEQTLLLPSLVEAVKSEECVQIASARDHTVMLMASGLLYSCGLNDSHQLGQFPIPNCSLHPKQMNHKVFKGRVIEGVAAQRFHTVVYTKDTIYTFGLNAGQLGHLKVPGEQYVSQPRQVSALNHPDMQIRLVTSSDAATVVVTKKGDVYALHEYQCRKVVSKWLDVVEVAVSGGHLDHSSDLDTLRERGGTELTVVLLNSAGKVFLWRASDPVIRRCVWGIRRPLRMIHLAVSIQNMSFVTPDGEAFTAAIPRRHRGTSTSKTDGSVASSPPADTFSMSVSELVDREEVEDVRITRIPTIHRANHIMVDRKGNNFAVLQSQPNSNLTEVPTIDGSEMSNHLRTLHEEANEFDTIHNVIIQVGKSRFAAHSYILSSRSEYFRERLVNKHPDSAGLEEEEGTRTFDLDNVNLDIFQQMMLYMYTDTCDLLRPGASFTFTDTGLSDNKTPASLDKNKKKKGKDSKSEKEESSTTQSRRNPAKLLQEMGKKYGVKNLAKRLEAVKFINGRVSTVQGKHLTQPNLRFERRKYGVLYDVCIQGEDGDKVQCHKCVLVARLEYFHSMLASGWIETSNTNALTLPVPGDILLIIIDYLYTDAAPKVTDCEDVEFLCNVLVVADQLLITRLKHITEVAIANLLSLRNVCEVLEFASIYNANQLQVTCQQFICLNLAALLEIRGLQVLGEDVMDQLTAYYRNMVSGMSRRMITPYDEFPRSSYLEALEAAAEKEAAEPTNPVVKETEHTNKKPRNRRRRTRTKSSGEDGEQSGGKRKSSLSLDAELSLELEGVVLEDVNEEGGSTATSPISPQEEELRIPIRIQKRDFSHPLTAIKKPHQPSTSPVSPTETPVEQPLSTSGAVRTGINGHSSTPGSMETCDKMAGGDNMGLRDIMAEQDMDQGPAPKTSSAGKKMNKMSQKERKRLAARTNETKKKESTTSQSPTSPTPTSTPTTPTPQAWTTPPAWGAKNIVTSFKDLMVSEAKEVAFPSMSGSKVNTSSSKPISKPRSTPINNASSPAIASSPPSQRTDSKISWGLPMRAARTSRQTSQSASSPPANPSPTENPWKQAPAPAPTAPPTQQLAPPLTPPTTTATGQAVSLNQIMSDEIQQKKTLVKLTNKPLHLIQIEEQAIQELLIHYKAADTWDEYITVSREHGNAQMATPTWAATQ